MPKKPIKVFGDKIAITELGMEMEGSIVLPFNPNAQADFRLGKVVDTGDGTGLVRYGRLTFPLPGKMFVSEGDAVIFQIPRSATITSSYKIKDVGLVNVIIQPDCLARLNPTVTKGEDGVETSKYIAKIDSLETLGDWVLLEGYQVKTDEVILRPENAADITTFRFRVLQLGVGGNWDTCGFKVNDEVAIERARVAPLQLQTESAFNLPKISEYFFLHKDYVLGVIDES